MIKQTITYKDFDENEVVEDFFFHMSKADLTEYMLGKPGDFQEYVKAITNDEAVGPLIGLFKELISLSVGKFAADGNRRRFFKSQEITDDFMQSAAYSEFFMSIITDAKKATEFFNGVVPKDLADEVEKIQGQGHGAKQLTVFPHSEEQLLAMTPEEFDKVAGKDPSKMSKYHLEIAFRRRATNR